MPMMVTPRKVAPESGTRIKTEQPKPKKPKLPRSIREIDKMLSRLGPYPMVKGPYAAEDYDALTRRRLDWTEQRRRLLGLRQELSKRTDNNAIAAKATEEISVDLPDERKRLRANMTRVRQSEAWRHKQLTSMQRQAEIEMELAWRSRGPGLGATSSRYGEPRGGANLANMGIAMDQTWRDWDERAPSRGVNIDVFLDCLAEPLTLADVEKRRKLKPGSALANYQVGLDLWSELRGWVHRS